MLPTLSTKYQTHKEAITSITEHIQAETQVFESQPYVVNIVKEIHLILNLRGKDLGIYALWQHPSLGPSLHFIYLFVLM